MNGPKVPAKTCIFLIVAAESKFHNFINITMILLFKHVSVMDRSTLF